MEFHREHVHLCLIGSFSKSCDNRFNGTQLFMSVTLQSLGKIPFGLQDGPTNASEMRDNPAETLIEHLESGIKWYEPRDLTVEEAVYILTNPKSIDSIYIKPRLL